MAKKPASKAPAVSRPSLKLNSFTAATVADAITATGSKKTAGLVMVPIAGITELPGFNLRVTDTPEYKAGIDELRDSMLQVGYMPGKPMMGFAATLNGTASIVIIDGHRRFDAVKSAIENGADIESIPFILQPPTATDLDLAVTLHNANTGVALTMLERAVLAKRMRASGLSDAEVASKLRVTARHVNDLGVLIAAPKEVRELIKAGMLSATEAVARLRADPEGGAAKLVDLAAKKTARAETTGDGKGSKLTKKTIDSGGETPTVKMQTIRMNFSAQEGATFIYEDVEPFLGVIGDSAWFKPARKKAERISLEDMRIEVIIRRPKPADEAMDAVADTSETAPAAKNGKGKKGKPAPVEAPADDDDDFGPVADEDDDGGGAPDLRELGVADPASDSDL